jgi:hypothetical protein
MALWRWMRASRLRTSVIGAAAILAVPVIGFGWWLGSPLFLNKTVNEEFPAVSTGPESVPAATALLTGLFEDEDSLHRGSGAATVYDLGDGAMSLRLEDFSVTNGPDLFVLLMKDPEGRDTDLGYIDLGSLKGNRGNQNYDIPAGVDLSEYKAAMIYCRAFHVVFSVAALNPA